MSVLEMADEHSESIGPASRGSAVRPTQAIADFVTVIAQQCRQHPTKLAVTASDRRLSYRALALRVSEIADMLAKSGVTVNSLVAICMPRGADELTTMLAVLTLGAAYVPLDPAQPSSRLAMIIADSCPDLLITKNGYAAVFEANSPRVVVIDEVTGALDRFAEPSWMPREDSESRAYVLFTSGSTGRPKGVEISRGAVSNLLSSMVRKPGLSECDVLLAVSTTMFDIAVLELFGPLYVGGTVHIAGPEIVRDGRQLRAALENEQVSVMQATPTMWHMLLDSGWTGDGRLRMLVGGEPLSPNLARRLLRRGAVWNMYGPTETTVWSTCKRIERPENVTIGRPIDNTQVYILDDKNRILQPGSIGELCIGGAGLARGYLGRPDLTAERFIQSPIGEPGERLYRTGDLARLLDSGEYECLGRMDHQVKIRGFRVELGEIEHALTELDCFSRAVVVKWEPADRAPMLVAYVVPRPGSDLEPREVSRQLRERVPGYMVPGRYIRMSAFPLTPNKKIDRRALPDPGSVPDPRAQLQPVPALTETERQLVRIWSDVLGLEHIARDDDFFDLGGQSVLAVRICDRIQRAMNVALPVSALLDNRTVEELASYIDLLGAGTVSQRWSSLVPIQPDGPLPPIFCASGVGGNPMTFLDLAAALGPQQPFYGLQHRGVDGQRRPHPSIEAMAGEFIDDIRSAYPTGPYILAGYSAGGLAAYEAARVLADAGERVRLVILFDTLRPRMSDWSRGERIRAHWMNVKATGTSYLIDRLAYRVTSAMGVAAMHLRAGLAIWWPFRFRSDAVELAGCRAEAVYTPGSYAGDVLLFRSDGEIGSERGIPRKGHPSNGWKDLVEGHLDVVSVRASHLDIVDGDASRFVASKIRTALTATAPLTDEGE